MFSKLWNIALSSTVLQYSAMHRVPSGSQGAGLSFKQVSSAAAFL